MKENMRINQYDLLFCGNEKNKREKLLCLMNDWRKEISDKPDIIFYDDKKYYKTKDYFGIDGFFPKYLSQKHKVLFIGREARNNSGNDSVLGTIDYFMKNNEKINSSTFYRRLLYLTYGIINKGKIAFEDLPYANEIAQNMIITKRFGFALMNISKYSNDRADGAKADVKLINQFLEDSNLEKRNFILEEIELLQPDIIITANLWDGKINSSHLSRIFPNLTFIKSVEGKLNYYQMNTKKKTFLIIDLWHFSMPGSDEKLYYSPVINLLKEINFF